MKRAAWVLVLAIAACTADGNATFDVRESVAQLALTHAPPGATLTLVDSLDQVVQTGTADALGSYIFRALPPGHGYRIKTGSEVSRHLSVLTVEESKPSQDFYRRQKLQPGFNYLKTRDGTTLSAYITLPGPPEMGPYPTVVTYSGYDPSKPGEPLGKYAFLCDQIPALCDAPADPGALLAAIFGYATVGVNVRGTGCSGGAYDFFETMQLLDGYDVIETVAAQDWVMHHKVGMVGLSYPGITQLFVAAQKPPSLAAITPLSVIGNTATTLLPGGILNNGFALSWVTNVLDRAKPYGQGWEQPRVDGGDTVCAENQLLHGQLIDNVAMATTIQFYDPAQHDRINPTTFVDQIDVPVFLAGGWQDEQTGPFFFTLLDKFKRTAGNRFTVYNGVHPDGFQPGILVEWQSFLDLFVAQRVPLDQPLVRDLSPLLFEQVFKTMERLPANRFTGYDTYDEALAAWNDEPPVRALWESGMGDTTMLGAPRPTFERSFAAWPPPEQRVLRLWMHAGGRLTGEVPHDASAASGFELDPAAGDRGILQPGADVWDPLPAYDWRAPEPGKAVVFESDVLDQEAVLFGTGSVDLWVKSTVDDANLQVTLSEVRPDGKEMYVQSGWLRASKRALVADATDLWPLPTFLEKDYRPLVPGEWTPARVALAAFQHVFRPGSRLRLLIDTPGGSRAEWRFDLKKFPGPVTHSIGHDEAHPSSVALPLIDGMIAPSTLPTCPSLRGQPCRDYTPYTNTPAP